MSEILSKASMRKRPITLIPQAGTPLDEGWLDLDCAAVVQVTSAAKDYPVESAGIVGEMRGWRASRVWHTNDPANLRSAAKSHTHRARLRRGRDAVYPRARLAMADARFERLCPSYGISAPLTRATRSRNIGLNFPVFPFLNWLLRPTSVGDRLAPRLRVCAYLDSLRGGFWERHFSRISTICGYSGLSLNRIAVLRPYRFPHRPRLFCEDRDGQRSQQDGTD
jgi:hypothetical protein